MISGLLREILGFGAFFHDLNPAKNGVEWGAQFVRERGEEFGFEAVGAP